MRTYRVMLVDDEAEAIQTIRQRIPWEELGFTPPRCAANGLEALELAEEEAPDIVMTDIKMPYMDGLELSRRLKELLPNVRIIIFSGFDEFEYAREAIRLEAEEYVLKPLNAAELTKVFERIRDQLNREYDEQQNVKKLQEYYSQSLPLLQEHFYTALLDSKLSGDMLEKQIREFGIDLTGPCYCIGVLHAGGTLPEGFTPELLALSIRRLAEERLDPKWKGRFFSYLGNTVVIAQMRGRSEVTAFTDDCDRFCRLAESVCKASVTAGIGPVCTRLEELPACYYGARNALSYRVIYGRGKAINIAEIAPQETNSSEAAGDDALRQIFKLIRMGEEESMVAGISEYVRRGAAAQGSIQGYRFFAMELLGELYRFARSNQLAADVIVAGNGDIFSQLREPDPEQLADWMTGVCRIMQEMIRTKRNDSSRSFVAGAMDYARENFGREDLSLESICHHLGVSAAYFSTVFKRETGKTFVNYLTELRMNRAAELLETSDEKTYMIAREVGYSDPNYFSYVFKKHFGVSPSRYKTSAMERRL